ncbi:MAG TPA: YdeI/OmpD-associated family protein [Saprospiraceae bacterium]|nr:YdeI/OmpD-associated family protein [Saprospiraceae bacterium]HND87763.1 YdeI/OmpD-associated family protein [Saprospiraceae bacterium]HNG90931.1 YdeI/OmpD-associated family protein [Saprospiraceae bacterium]
MEFEAPLDIIGINPFVTLPDEVLRHLSGQAGRDRGPIPVCGSVNGLPYRQTLVRYAGQWRLYINMGMLKDSPRRIGEVLRISVGYDPDLRVLMPPPAFMQALSAEPEAQAVFEGLPPSRQQEIVRYLCRLKSQESLRRNIERAIRFLLRQERFVGRDRP